MIRNVVFDLGQVLFKFSPRHYLEKEFPSNKVELLYKEVFREKEWKKLLRGTITYEKAQEEIAERKIASYEDVKKIFEERKKFITPIKENINLIESLLDLEYSVFLLGDFHKEIFYEFLEEIPALQEISGKVLSFEVDMLKCEKEIYSYFLKKYHLDPKETLLIDDTRKNIENAECFSMKGLLLKKPEDLSVELEKIDIL
jgi:putative hydrolase of the HAD superfamily